MTFTTLSDGSRVLCGQHGIYFVPAPDLSDLAEQTREFLAEPALRPFAMCVFVHDSVEVTAPPLRMGDPLHAEVARVVSEMLTARAGTPIHFTADLSGFDWSNL